MTTPDPDLDPSDPRLVRIDELAEKLLYDVRDQLQALRPGQSGLQFTPYTLVEVGTIADDVCRKLFDVLADESIDVAGYRHLFTSVVGGLISLHDR